MDFNIIDITQKDDKAAYEKTKEVIAISNFSNEYYEYFDEFASLLNNEKSYIRTRVFLIICALAKWDEEGKIEDILPDLLVFFHDQKPSVVRQSLKAIKDIIVNKPHLIQEIKKELDSIDMNQYKESMMSLIKKDIEELLEVINVTKM